MEINANLNRVVHRDPVLMTRSIKPGKSESFTRIIDGGITVRQKGGGEKSSEEEPEDGGAEVFELSFSSEEPYQRFIDAPEVLDHSDGCVDLQRLKDLGVVLFNHERNFVIGKILDARIEGGRGLATVQFDDDATSQAIADKVRNCTLKGVSVGYTVDDWEEVRAGKKSEDGRFSGACMIAKRWTPYEISIVSVPADPTVGVNRSDDFFMHDTALNRPYLRGLASKQVEINKNRRVLFWV